MNTPHKMGRAFEVCKPKLLCGQQLAAMPLKSPFRLMQRERAA
jgi:hypothetical protein